MQQPGKGTTGAKIEVASMIAMLEYLLPELRGISSLASYFVHLAILALSQERYRRAGPAGG
jgi:hypothetical protein